MFNNKQLLTLNLSTHCGGFPIQRLFPKTESTDLELFSVCLKHNDSWALAIRGSKAALEECSGFLWTGSCSSMSTHISLGNCCNTEISTWLRDEGIRSLFSSAEAGSTTFKDTAPETDTSWISSILYCLT